MKFLSKTIWAITPEMLQTMTEVADKTNSTIEAIAKEQGREMKNSYAVSIRDGVAIISVKGPLFRYANLMTMICGATSYEILATDFHKALDDTNIKAIVFDIDSPGGEVNGCSELADMIFASRGKKPIIAYASGACCSGAYWIASACDEIKTADTAILSSIGVVSIYQNDNDKNCVEIVSSQSPNKRPDLKTDEGKAKVQVRIDELADIFICKVAKSRNISPQEVIENFGGGDVFVGANAVRIGLADSLSSFEGTLADLNKEEETFMKEENQIDIKSQERERMAKVFAADITKGKEATAQILLAKTDLDAEDIVAILQTVPVQAKNSFDDAMAKIKNPEITPSATIGDKQPEAIAARIASHLMEAK